MMFRRTLLLASLLLATPLLPAQAPAAKSAATAKPAAVTKAAATADKGAPLDINTATPDQLMQLPGVGAAYSKRIVDGRPYTAKNQLETRGIVPKATYAGIADKIIAKRPGK